MKIIIRSFPIAVVLCVVASLCGCRLSAESAPMIYRGVSTVKISDENLGEAFGIAVRDESIYVSDGAAGTIRIIGRDGSSRVLASGLKTPSAIAFLPDGSLAVADTGSHTIKRIADDGTATTIAGVEGTAGSADGPDATATFNAPVGIAVATDGSIYVADTYNDRIRRIRDGTVTTVAGQQRGFSDGLGSAAQFDTPLGIAVLDDVLLVADSGNARIRVIDKNGIVQTLTGDGERDLVDGTLGSARFVQPTAIATDQLGRIFVADGNAIRLIGARSIPFVETIAGDHRGFADGASRVARFNRPSGLVLDGKGSLYIADSDNRAIRILADDVPSDAYKLTKEETLPLATRWPFDPPSNPREVAGTLGEIRGDLKPNGKPVWFHNGLDIAGAYGETAKFIRDETVLDPHSADNFGTARELLRLPLIGYIHLRLGRDKDDRPFADPRFQFERDATGKLTDVRVPRGARFLSGESIGTLNAMNHVHLIAGRSGEEINALAALQLPGIHDSIVPVIEEARLFDANWSAIDPKSLLPSNIRIVVRGYDRMDGNSERRRLGVYRIGYQLQSNGSPLGEIEWRISFQHAPSNDVVRLAYADGSRSGYTPDTVFDYIATNHVDGENAREDFLDTTQLAPGKYLLRVFAADYFGNIASKDIEVVK